MENQEDEKYVKAQEMVEELLTYTRDYLKAVVNKSGIRTDIDELNSTISFVMGDNHKRSVFLGEFVPPTDEEPASQIRLHIDALVDYSIYQGVDYSSLAAKVLLTQIHHTFTWQSKEKFDFEKAEQFASKACRKLNRQGIVKDLRPKMYIGPSNSNSLEITARQKWIDQWLKKEFDEVGVYPKDNQGAIAPPDPTNNTDA
jgi:hypothetical protein